MTWDTFLPGVYAGLLSELKYLYYCTTQDADNGATSKIDNVLAEHGGLLHVLPLAVILKCLKVVG